MEELKAHFAAISAAFGSEDGAQLASLFSWEGTPVCLPQAACTSCDHGVSQTAQRVRGSFTSFLGQQRNIKQSCAGLLEPTYVDLTSSVLEALLEATRGNMAAAFGHQNLALQYVLCRARPCFAIDLKLPCQERDGDVRQIRRKLDAARCSHDNYGLPAARKRGLYSLSVPMLELPN
jgi:hypothetical protein